MVKQLTNKPHIVVKKIKITIKKRGGKRVRNKSKNSVNNSSTTSTIRKSRSSSNSACARSGLPKSTISFGLPSFHHRTNDDAFENIEIDGGDNSSASKVVDNESGCFQEDDGDGQEEEIPSDTFMAIQSLIQASRGLHIPITKGYSIQAILESQIYSNFNDDHMSSVNTELIELILNNQIRRIYCRSNVATTSIAYILTEDYVKAIWDATYNQSLHQSLVTVANNKTTARSEYTNSEKITSWFVSNLHCWTKDNISESNLQDIWENNNNNNNNTVDDNNSINDVISYLLDSNFLIRDANNNTDFCRGHKEQYYLLWLPQWGIVLKAWDEARKQLLNLLAREKEISETNILQKNRNSYFSTDFLLRDLLQKEKICIVKRPFGNFISKIE